MTRIESPAQIVGEETVKLFARVTVVGKTQFVPFEKRILWIRNSTASKVLRWDSADLDELGSIWDYYGYLSSVEVAIKDAKKLAEKLAILSTDRLSVEVDVKITERAVIECLDRGALERIEKYGDKARRVYLQPSWSGGDEWYTSDVPRPKPEGPNKDNWPEEWTDRHPRFETERTYFERAGIFSTRRPNEELAIMGWIEDERRKAKAAS